MNFLTNFTLLEHNTFHIDEYADIFCSIQNEEEAMDVIKNAKDTKNPLHFIGGGSNILLTQRAHGIICLNQLKGIQIIQENDDEVIIKFQSGENWHDCVLWCVSRDYGGIENLSLIPGTIGAAPIQNIGAYGVELKDVFESCETIQLSTLKKQVFTNEDCMFGYRDSIFKQAEKGLHLILSVTLRLSKKHILKLDYGNIKEELALKKIEQPTIQDISDAVISIRKSKLPDPAVLGNAGSFFKNPVISLEHFHSLKNTHPTMPSFTSGDQMKIPAAWLIESQGWKGYRDGDVGVHDKQALVLVNYGNAQGKSLLNLSEKIITSVQQAFNIELEREVNIW